MDGQALVFWVLAAVGTVSALMVITRRNPVHSALYLIVTFFTVAAVYVVLQAEFIAVVQVLVYAGGIMVLFLFVILLVEVRREASLRTIGGLHLAGSGLLAALVVGSIGAYVLASPVETSAGASAPALFEAGGNIETVALVLFRHYLLPFEVISVLLLVALVGAVVLARARY